MHAGIILPAMSRIVSHLKSQPRLYVAAAVGMAVALLLPEAPRWTTRALLGWNVAVWLYLLLIGLMMLRADHGHLRRSAAAQAQGAAVVLGVVVAAALASVAAIVVELAAAKAAAGAIWPHLLFALTTVVGSWLLLPVLFALDYASRYYRPEVPGGLAFPGADGHFHPDYTDFLYFSFTIAVASQTSDVTITSRPLRQLALLQSILSFAFNTAILALTINIAASLF
jgi:uncharacterized membrane protein